MAGFDDVDKSSLTGVEETQAEQEEQSESVAMEQARDDAMNEGAEEARREEILRRNQDQIEARRLARYNDAVKQAREQGSTNSFDKKEIEGERADMRRVQPLPQGGVGIGLPINDDKGNLIELKQYKILKQPSRSKKEFVNPNPFISPQPDYAKMGVTFFNGESYGKRTQSTKNTPPPTTNAPKYLSEDMLGIPGVTFFASKGVPAGTQYATPTIDQPIGGQGKKNLNDIFGYMQRGKEIAKDKEEYTDSRNKSKQAKKESQQEESLRESNKNKVIGRYDDAIESFGKFTKPPDVKGKKDGNQPTPLFTFPLASQRKEFTSIAVRDRNVNSEGKDENGVVGITKYLIDIVNTEAPRVNKKSKKEQVEYTRGEVYQKSMSEIGTRINKPNKYIGDEERPFSLFGFDVGVKELPNRHPELYPSGTPEDISGDDKPRGFLDKTLVGIDPAYGSRGEYSEYSVAGYVGMPHSPTRTPTKYTPTVPTTYKKFGGHFGGERTAWEIAHPAAYEVQKSSQRQHDTYMKANHPREYLRYTSIPTSNKENAYYDPNMQQPGKQKPTGSTQQPTPLRGKDVYESLTPYQRKLYGIEKGKVNITQFAKIKTKVDATRRAGVKSAIFGMETIVAGEHERKEKESTSKRLEAELVFAFAASDASKAKAQKRISDKAIREEQEDKQRSSMDSLRALGKLHIEQQAETARTEKIDRDIKEKNLSDRLANAFVPGMERIKSDRESEDSKHRFRVKSTTADMVEKLAEKRAEVKRLSLHKQHASPMENAIGHTEFGKKIFGEEPHNVKYNKEKEDALHKAAGAPPLKVGKGLILASLEDSLVKGVKSEVSRYKDDLMAGRKARAEENRRSFFYGGGLQPVNITKKNPEGEFPKQTGKTARRRHKNPVTGTELSFFGKPFGAPKAPRRTRRGKIIKLTPAQRKRNSRKPKSFLDDVFGSRW